MKPVEYKGHGFNYERFHPGFLEVFYGPMKADKSFNLISRVNKFTFSGGLEYLAFKPEGDTRTPGKIVSRMGLEGKPVLEIPAIEIPENNPGLMSNYVTDKHGLLVLGEAQRFSSDIISVVDEWLIQGRNVIVECLNLDFRKEPYGSASYFITHADMAYPLFASCVYPVVGVEGNLVPCSNRAQFTQRLINGEPAPYNDPVDYVEPKEQFNQKATSDVSSIKPKDERTYEPRCRLHHVVPGRSRNGLKK